ncbi:MAG: glycosyltransferase [Anaerolineae bacterium]|nr:glycosyltransferase [Anaerolineae bacterium]
MTQRRRILFLTPQLPYPPHQGTAIRNWHVVQHVARQHEVDLLSFATRPDTDLAAAGPLSGLVNRLTVVPAPRRTRLRRVADLLRGRADMTQRLASREFVEQLAAALAHGYDIVQAEGIEMAPYLTLIHRWRSVKSQPRRTDDWTATGGAGRRLVYDAHNAEALLQQRNCLTDLRRPRRWVAALYSLVQWRRLAQVEAHLLDRVDRVIAVSDADAAALRRLAPDVQPLVVPNGVDTTYYDPGLPETHAPLSLSAPLEAGQPLLVFTGKLDYRPNIEACTWLVHHVMPRLWAEHPTAHVALVGRDPAPTVQALASPRVTVTGWVPDTRPYMASATVFVAPLRVGGGTRLKLLEALAMGCPIVSTSQGAEGLDLSGAARLADDADAFAHVAAQLIQDEARRAALGQAARRLALARYDWRAILPRLDAVYA